MSMHLQHEEMTELSSFWSWAIVVVFCVVIVLWGIFNYRSIPDAPRHWDTGTLRDVPGQSIYGTSEPQPGAAVPAQIVPLPETTPVRKASP